MKCILLSFILLTISFFGRGQDKSFRGNWMTQETIKVQISSWELETQINATFEIYFGDDGSFSISIDDDNQLKQKAFNFYKENNGLDYNKYEVIRKQGKTYHLLLNSSHNEQERIQKIKINGDQLNFFISLADGTEKILNLTRSQ